MEEIEYSAVELSLIEYLNEYFDIQDDKKQVEKLNFNDDEVFKNHIKNAPHVFHFLNTILKECFMAEKM